MARPEVKFDLHVHSRFSKDSVAPVWQIEEERKRRGLEGIAITDHNTITETTRVLKENFCPSFILGEEILTLNQNDSGKEIEIIGLFLQEPISPEQTVDETIYLIGAQDGIVVLPHPFEEWRHGAGDRGSRYVIEACLRRNIPVAIEIYNARARMLNFNFQAEMLWQDFREKGVLATAGSDAHRIPEISRAYVGIPPFQTKEEFLEALKQAKIYGEVNAFGTAYHRLMNRIELVIGSSFRDLGKRITKK